MNTTVAITGAAGNLGVKLRSHFADRYRLVLLDKDAHGDPAITAMDLSRWSDELPATLDGVDVVVHLAANPQADALWEELFEPNVDAAFNVFEAATRAGVGRIVFASSNHVMGGYKCRCGPGELTEDLPPRPGAIYEKEGRTLNSSAYAATKLMGERLGRCYAARGTMTVVALRIGWVRPGENRPEDVMARGDRWFEGMWLSNRDYCQLAARCIETELSQGFYIFNAMSNNAGMPWSIKAARELVGYQPSDGIRRDAPGRPGN